MNFLEILEAVSPPYLLKLDVYALTASHTRDEPMLLHPSVPTCFKLGFNLI